jgi:hypothetical protein
MGTVAWLSATHPRKKSAKILASMFDRFATKCSLALLLWGISSLFYRTLIDKRDLRRND